MFCSCFSQAEQALPQPIQLNTHLQIDNEPINPETWQQISLSMRMQVGIVCISLAQVVFIIAPDHSLWAWGTAIFLISLGEVITFPLMNVQVDRIAPPHLKGVYYGATSLYAFGFSLAPFIGGIILK